MAISNKKKMLILNHYFGENGKKKLKKREIEKVAKCSYNTITTKINEEVKRRKVEGYAEVIDKVAIEQIRPMIEEIANGSKLLSIYHLVVNKIEAKLKLSDIDDELEDIDMRTLAGLLNILGGLNNKATDTLAKINSSVLDEDDMKPMDNGYRKALKIEHKLEDKSHLISSESYVQDD